MAATVDEVARKRFEWLVDFFEKSIWVINCGYRGKTIRAHNYIFPLIFFISTCFNLDYVRLTYNSTNRVQAIYTIIFIAVHMQSLGKGLMLVINYHDFKNLFSELRKFYTEGENGLVKEIRMRNNAAHIPGITIGVFVYCSMLWGAEIFLQFFIRRMGGVVFPMQYHIPFISETNPWFNIINYTVQDFIFIVTFIAISVSDGLIIMIAFHFRSELISVAELISILDDVEQYKKYKDILLTIHRMHWNLVHLFNFLSDVYFYMSFAQVTSTFVGATFLLYAVMDNGLDVANGVVIAVVALQILILCLFGEIIFVRTEALSNLLYQTKWYEFTPRDKLYFLFILQNIQKPWGLKAVGVIDVSLYTFIELVKLCGTYCVVFYALVNQNRQ
ncbi:odorant receptor 85b-like [Lutzomyia longipalpis]|uniref:odorant receptor 85b-like n=1 Tax=Lutzomyia longipalpis TaxID=7200 RepID=UPI0024844BA8|nr:odorant receptor 85b-like [Lutzomyia longipalpis]